MVQYVTIEYEQQFGFDKNAAKRKMHSKLSIKDGDFGGFTFELKS